MRLVVDGNQAAGAVAHRTTEVIAIYPITPSSPMAELADERSAAGSGNIWGTVPKITAMQSEGGAAGAVHGALQAGALTTTFTASQGLLLMIPNMFKIAGELTPFCMHVSARTVATHALSIFGDHSDVMACRGTGFALFAAGSVQEAQDFACIAQAATLEARVPFLHFFDGFRTSHELATIEGLSDDDLRAMIDESLVTAHRRRALTPDRPVIRGTAQNPDVFFQAREAANPFYLACPQTVQRYMNAFARLVGRQYRLFDYVGHAAAERVIVVMGSGAETAHETTEWLCSRGEKVGLIKVRLFQPFDTSAFLAALPATVRSIAVLDRTKEPGSIGEPLYLNVVAAVKEARQSGSSPLQYEPRIIGGRYGISSKEFTPAMVHAVFDELTVEQPKLHFTVGIMDDVTHTSLAFDPDEDIEPEDIVRAIFFGLGADGTVGANKNTLKIIADGTGHHGQGHFVYDSKKAGAVTISHLRFGPRPIRSAYCIRRAHFVACHQFAFVDRLDILDCAAPGAVFLLNAPYGVEAVWEHLPREVQEQIISKHLRLWVIDAYKVAKDAGLGRRINTVMQTCFFAVSKVLALETAIEAIKASIRGTYEKAGPAVIEQNCRAVDNTVQHLHEVPVPQTATATHSRPALVPESAPDFVKRVTAVIMAGNGNLLPVSAFPVDGTWPTGTSKWEKRNIAQEIPRWDPDTCSQCNRCVEVCPHSAIRANVFTPEGLTGVPATFKAVAARGNAFGPGMMYALQVAPEDCTGCNACVEVCPARPRALAMVPQAPLREAERMNWEYFLRLPTPSLLNVPLNVQSVQIRPPLFQFSGACAGCGETPYLKLLTQLFGDRLLIANATGCSSIYGGNLPTTPYTIDQEGRGPVWSNSLFEDNAEFGLGFRLAIGQHEAQARALLRALAPEIGETLVSAIFEAEQSDEQGIAKQRQRIVALRSKLADIGGVNASRLLTLADYLVWKSVWAVGGDGWAYDIGFGGLDHVLASGHNVNILVLDTEVYANTGGQRSKATPLGAVAKFAAAGKETPKKDLGMLALAYGNVYVASVALGASNKQTLLAFREAESYPGPSLVIAYSHCMEHGCEMSMGAGQQKAAVEAGYWLLYRYDPRRSLTGKNPLQLDSREPRGDLGAFLESERRFRVVKERDPDGFARLVVAAQQAARQRYTHYCRLAAAAT